MHSSYTSGLLLTIVYLAMLTYEFGADSNNNNEKFQKAGEQDVNDGLGRRMPKPMFEKMCAIDMTNVTNKDKFCHGKKDIDNLCGALCNCILGIPNSRCAEYSPPKLNLCGCTKHANADPTNRSTYFWITRDKCDKQVQTCPNGFKVVNFDG